MVRNAFRRLVDATEASPIQFFIVSFSASRLNGLAFFFLPLSLSFLDFLAAAALELEKNEVGVELLLDWGWEDARDVWRECVDGLETSSSSSSASNGFCSVSRRTFDLS